MHQSILGNARLVIEVTIYIINLSIMLSSISICKLMPDTEGSSPFRIPSEARDSKAKITRGRGLTGLDQHKMSANPD